MRSDGRRADDQSVEVECSYDILPGKEDGACIKGTT
nr:hypothetical protein HIGPJJAF_00045 [Gallid alphaherpesvirus 2]